MDKRGIVLFILLTFAITYMAELVVLLSGLESFQQRTSISFLAFCVMMYVPGLVAFVLNRRDKNSVSSSITIWPVPGQMVVRAIFVIPLLFVVIYGLGYALGWSQADWQVSQLVELSDDARRMNQDISIFPYMLIGLGMGILFVSGPTLYALICLGSEYGWRGYLLPRLMPLGRVPAYIITGVLWGLWFAPIVLSGLLGTEHPVGTLIRVCLVTVVFGAFLGEVYRRTRNVGLVAICCGCFAAQSDIGIWNSIFYVQDVPWAGPFGVISIIVWTVAALFPFIVIGPSKEPSDSPDSTTQEA